MLNLKRSSFAIAILSILLLILTLSPVSEVDSVNSCRSTSRAIVVDNDSIISVVSVTDGTNLGFMTLGHRRSA